MRRVTIFGKANLLSRVGYIYGLTSIALRGVKQVACKPRMGRRRGMGEGCTQVGGQADPNFLSIATHPSIHCGSK